MPSWFAKPETVYATVLFFLSVLVSIFAGNIKQFFTSNPLKTNETIIALNQRELALVERLQNNAYALVLWALWNFVIVLRVVLFLIVIAAAGSIIDHFFGSRKPLDLFPLSLPPLITGGLVGRSVAMYEVIQSLYNYDKYTAKLKQNIAKAQEAIRVSLLAG